MNKINYGTTHYILESILDCFFFTYKLINEHLNQRDQYN